MVFILWFIYIYICVLTNSVYSRTHATHTTQPPQPRQPPQPTIYIYIYIYIYKIYIYVCMYNEVLECSLYMCSLYVFSRRLLEAPRDGGAHAQDDWVEYTVPPGRWLHSGSNSSSSSSYHHHHLLLLLLMWSIQCLQDACFTLLWMVWLCGGGIHHCLIGVWSRCYSSRVTMWLCITRMYSPYMCSLCMSRHVVIRYC
jgi:hypothetical protein